MLRASRAIMSVLPPAPKRHDDGHTAGSANPSRAAGRPAPRSRRMIERLSGNGTKHVIPHVTERFPVLRRTSAESSRASRTSLGWQASGPRIRLSTTH
jgi:hypothetical protein